MRHWFILLTFATVVVCPNLSAKNKHRGEEWESARFRPEHHQMIREFYREDPRGLPPGLAKRGGDLPPGLAKKLRRDGRLPPGLDKRLVPFPVELERRLPPLPPHYRRCFAGDRAVVYDDRSGGIVDSFTVVIRVGR